MEGGGWGKREGAAGHGSFAWVCGSPLSLAVLAWASTSIENL